VNTLSTRRKTFALIALALGGFGIGSTEFVAMGLLPNIAQDLLPWASSSGPRPSRPCRRTCRRRSC
jgi:DHA1 family inner membrane transport protein